MSDPDPGRPDGLKRWITGRQPFFHTLGDVPGSGIYVLVGLLEQLDNRRASAPADAD